MSCGGFSPAVRITSLCATAPLYILIHNVLTALALAALRSMFPFFSYAILSETKLIHSIWSETTAQEWNQSGIVPKLKTYASCSLSAECGVSLFCVVESAVGLCTGSHRCHTRGQIVMIAYGAS